MSDPNRFSTHYDGAQLEDLPCFHPEPDEDLVALFELVLDEPSRVLDLGAGPAVHSIWLAQRGHTVVAVDGVASAKDMALALAADRGATIEYLVQDALALGDLPAFDLVLDRGFMHTLPEEERPAWRRAVTGALRPGGHLVLKCFDVKREREMGPPGLGALEMVEALGDPELGGLQLLSLARTQFGGSVVPHPTWTLLAQRPG